MPKFNINKKIYFRKLIYLTKIVLIVFNFIIIKHVHSTENEYLIKKYFKDKNLYEIEGIWSYYNKKLEKDIITTIYKADEIFVGLDENEKKVFSFKRYQNYYSGECQVTKNESDKKIIFKFQSLKVTQVSDNRLNWVCKFNVNNFKGYVRKTLNRVWPQNLSDHNKKINGAVSFNPDVSFNISQIKNKCMILLHKPKSKNFVDCVTDLASIQINREIDTYISKLKKNKNFAVIEKLQKLKNSASNMYLNNLEQQLLYPEKYNSNIYSESIKKCIVTAFGAVASMTCI